MTVPGTEYKTLGKYKVMGMLGRGSMGIVYRGFDPEIGRIVAIKTLRPVEFEKYGGVEGALERFRNEARSAGNLRHPNIITIFEVARDGDVPFIVMDCVEGQSLDTIINRQGKLQPPQAMAYLVQVASALDYAHSRGVIHRDVKPSNIMVDSHRTVFVLDFGVASINKSYADWDPPVDTPIVGTPDYMSPEQILNQKLDGRTDIFSLAVVAFECLTGSRPFHGESFGKLLHAVVHGEPTPLTVAAPELPLSLEAEFERALARDRDRRFTTAAEMIAAFSRALGIERADVLLHTPKPSAVTEPPRPPVSVQWQPTNSGAGPAVTPVQKEKTPGSMFRHADNLDPPLRRPGRQGGARVRAVLGLCAVLAGSALLFAALKPTLFGSPAPLPVAKETAPDLAPASNALRMPAVETAPPNSDLAGLNDRQLLGVLKDRMSDEARLVNALKEVQQRRVRDFVDLSPLLLEHDSYVVRVETLRVLGELGDQRIVPRMLLMLDDYDPTVRGAAARALGELRDRSATGYLYARLAREDSSDVQRAIRRAIESISGLPFREGTGGR